MVDQNHFPTAPLLWLILVQEMQPQPKRAPFTLSTTSEGHTGLARRRVKNPNFPSAKTLRPARRHPRAGVIGRDVCDFCGHNFDNFQLEQPSLVATKCPALRWGAVRRE